MKTTATTLLILLAAVRVNLAADAFPAITTTDGKTYDHITAQRTDPDGLYIEYVPDGKGIGTAKLKFSRLSPGLQKQYGYDPEAAKKYQNDAYQASLAFQAWAEKQDAAVQKARADAAARDLQEQAILAQRPPAPVVLATADPGPAASTIYGGGLSGAFYGRPARFNTPAQMTFQGQVPQELLFTPLGFSPNKTQVLTTSPRTGGNFSRVSTRLR